MTFLKILWYLFALCLIIGSLILGGVIVLAITVVVVLTVQAIISKRSRNQSQYTARGTTRSARAGTPGSGPNTTELTDQQEPDKLSETPEDAEIRFDSSVAEEPSTTTSKRPPAPKKMGTAKLVLVLVCSTVALVVVLGFGVLRLGAQSQQPNTPTPAQINTRNSPVPRNNVLQPTQMLSPTRSSANVGVILPNGQQVKEVEEGNHDLFLGPVAKAVNEGHSLMSEGRYLESLAAYTRAQELHPVPSSVLHNRIALVQYALGDPESAIGHYTYAIQINDSASSRLGRAMIYRDTNKCSSAIDDAQEALAQTPDTGPGYHSDAEAYAILAMCHLKQDQFAEAIQQADRSLALMSDEFYSAEAVANIHIIKGAAYTAYGLADHALDSYSFAIARNDTAGARVSRAFTYWEHGQCTSAIQDAEHALALEPEQEPGYHSNVEANVVLALCHYNAGNRTKALRHIESALKGAEDSGYQPNEIRDFTILRDDMNVHLRP